MQRMRSVIARAGLVLPMLWIGGAWIPAHADLIRPKPGRAYPDIAGDIVGTQTYQYDPATRTGIFSLINAPHLISLGPADKDLVPMQPRKDGTLTQSLTMKLDGKGRLVESPDNMFEIRGSVVIGRRDLRGHPPAVADPRRSGWPVRNPRRGTPPTSSISTWRLPEENSPSSSATRLISGSPPRRTAPSEGNFTSSFSAEKPRTNLRALKDLPTTVPEPTPLITLLTCGMGFLVYRLRRNLHRSNRRRGNSSDRPTSLWPSERV